MRLGVIMVVCGLAACEVNNGTYLAVDGEPAGITFDKVEFFLGKDAGTVTDRLHTPARPYDPQALSTPPERHRMLKRLFADSDVQTTAETRSLTYLLTTDANNAHAQYGLIVASRGGVAVGLGEIEDFKVLDDGAYVYEVALVPVDDGFERWGKPDSDAAACVRWTRQRIGEELTSTYAVVHGEDLDCDDTKSGAECDDLSYCDKALAPPGGCQARRTACIDPVGCNIGLCSDAAAGSTGGTTCQAQTCLPDNFCAPTDQCDENGPLAAFFECALKIGTAHIEVVMSVKTLGGGLCNHEFTVPGPLGMGCTNPQIEAPLLGKVGMWTFGVRQSAPGSDQCVFTMVGPSLDAPPPADTHLVVSVGRSNGTIGRTSFVIGFQPTADMAGCTTPVRLDLPPAGTETPTCP